MNYTECKQLELGVAEKRSYRNARHQRLKRAQWWFGKMREVVELAIPNRSITTPRPEQTYLKLRQHSLL